jgi:hypothetical protein
MILEKGNRLLKRVRLVHESEEALKDALSFYDEVTFISYKDDVLDYKNKVARTTVVVDLSKSLGDILQECNDTTRNEIRRSFNMPDLSVDFLHYSDNAFVECYKMYEFQERKQGRKPDALRKFAGNIFCAVRSDGRLMCAVSFFFNTEIIKVHSISSLRLYDIDQDIKKKISFASRRAIYEIISFGKKLGFKKLDLSYIDPQNPNKAGIDSFKRGFGGDIVQDFTYSFRNTKAVVALRFFKIIQWAKNFVSKKPKF